MTAVRMLSGLPRAYSAKVDTGFAIKICTKIIKPEHFPRQTGFHNGIPPCRKMLRARRPKINPTCAESGPFLDSTGIGTSQIKGLRRTKHRFDDVVPTDAVDADQSS